jgi:DNA polymerase III gamma/tau subunit
MGGRREGAQEVMNGFNNEPLHVKYRPTTFDDVIGHDAMLKALKGMVKRRDTQSFLFSGPAGTGKTKLARICARNLGCDPKDVIEIDGATHTGVEDMRAVQKVVQFRPFGKSTARAIIVDEAHRLSPNAWDSMLKLTEEPPPNAYWFLCTTNVGKVPHTIRTRFAGFTLNKVNDDNLGIIFDDVCKAEKIRLSDDVANLIIREAKGSPRQLLINLAQCRECRTKKDAAAVLRTVVDSDATLELCRFVIAGKGSWVKVMGLMQKLEEDDENPEAIRIIVCNYMGAALRKATSDKQAVALLDKLDAFAGSYNPAEGYAPLYQSIGRSLFS